MEVQLSYFKSYKMMLSQCCTQYVSKFRKLSSGHNWKRSVFIPIPKKGNAKECPNHHTVALISHARQVMLKILQARLQQYVNHELSDFQARFRKGRGTKDQIANIRWITEKEREFQRNICCCYCYVTSVVPDSVWSHRRHPTRLHHPWDSPGKNIGVGCHCLPQRSLLGVFKLRIEFLRVLRLRSPIPRCCSSQSASGSITINKASRGDGIPVELFQILKDDAVEVLHSICQQIWKTKQ